MLLGEPPQRVLDRTLIHRECFGDFGRYGWATAIDEESINLETDGGVDALSIHRPPFGTWSLFEPYDSNVENERLLAIQFRFEDCRNLSDGGAFFKRGYSVRYSILWVTNEMEVPFPYNLVVEGSADCTG
jgi:hypothetical protein